MTEKKQHLLGWITILLLFIIGVALLANIQRRQNLQKIAAVPASNGSLDLNLDTSGSIIPNGNFVVTLSYRSPDREIYGVDTILNFDRSKIEVLNIEPVTQIGNGCTGQGLVIAPIESESICAFKSNQIANANSTGILEFGAVSFEWNNNDPNYKPLALPATPVFSPLVKIHFHVLPSTSAGTTNINFQFTPGITTDSNIAVSNPNPQTGEKFAYDVLSQVSGVDIPIVNPQITPAGSPCPKFALGDINCDGYFDIADLSPIITNAKYTILGYGPTLPINTDFVNENNNGLTTISEITLFLQSYHASNNN